MKTSILRTIATLSLGAALGSVSLYAQARGPINVTVPFDFTVGSKHLAAGGYRVWQAEPEVLAIQRVDGTSHVMIAGDPSEASKTPGVARLTFNKYGDRYFLSQVSASSRGWKLRKSASEREALAKTAPAKPVILVAGE